MHDSHAPLANRLLPVMIGLGFLASACTSSVAPAIPTTSAAPAPTAAPSPDPRCPEPTEGAQLLRHEQHGYCVLVPDGYTRVDPLPYEMCLVPGDPGRMMCHSASAFIEVEDAVGRTADQVADQAIAGAEAAVPGIEIVRESLTVAGEPAVALEGLPGVGSTRWIGFVHDGRLYELIFGWDEASEDFPRMKRLHDTILTSFTFMPVDAPLPTSGDAGRGLGGSAVVVFAKDGEVVVWDEATGHSQVIFDGGDAIRVELSDDAQLVAFVRRSYFPAGGFDQNEQSALWVVDRDGSNPRELVSAAVLREQVDAAETDSSNFPRLDWIPNTHRLLYSGNTYEAHGYGEGAHTPLKGVYLIDAESLGGLELAPLDTSFHFVPSPDGRLVALVDTTGLLIFDVESGRQPLEFPAAPLVADTGWFAGAGVWTQDSSAFVINALVESTNVISGYELWRVPVDGSSEEKLISFQAGTASVVFAPDGSQAAVLGAATAVGPSARFLLPLPEDLGPVAVPRDTFDYSHLTWSPAGSAYILESLTLDEQGGMHGRRNLFPLCPNAAQDVEVCGPPIHLGEQIEWLEWVDRSRFLFVTYQPRRLYLGSLDGSQTPIAEDPQSFDAGAATCRDDSEFVADVTIPDGTRFAPDTYFQKTWRIRNSGDCTWDAPYRLTFLSGDRMSGPGSAPLEQIVQPGEELDLSVLLLAPAEAGTYRGQWQLFAPDGTPFGTRPYVQIQVP